MFGLQKLRIGKRITLIIIFLWLAGSSLLAFLCYWQAKDMLVQAIRSKALDIAALGALSLNASDHALLRQKSDQETDAYKRVEASLEKIGALDPEIKYIYTVRADESGAMFFIGDGSAEIAAAPP
jgi:sensor histidine kinase regulating citrate/malate metabolism